jgi:hypothetical protein
MAAHLAITHKSKRLAATARLYARVMVRVLAGDGLTVVCASVPALSCLVSCLLPHGEAAENSQCCGG